MFRKFSLFPFFFVLLGYQLGWSQNVPPVIQATGNQIYCPFTQIPVATTFNIIDVGNTAIPQLFIQISTGYIINQDKLFLIGSHPNITTSWNNAQGKLTLSVVGGALTNHTDLINAAKDVVFETEFQASNRDRFFSFSIGNANYLPSTGHYYEFIPSVGITWKDAKTAATNRNYYGIQGYLATIGSAEESQLAGEQASGAGWIGGTDEETEGVWKWATGPEIGTVFWNGGPNGSAPTGAYSNWNAQEPNNLDDEDYAHITAPGVGTKGSWNDLSNTGAVSGDYQPKGYIVEYGGTPGDPVIDISASTKITINPIFQVVDIPSVIPVIQECDTDLDGNATNGFTEFNLTDYKPNLSNGALQTDFTLRFYRDLSYSNLIANPTSFTNMVKDEQTIYVRIFSNLDSSCFIETVFLIRVDKLPVVLNSITYKNCDEDGIADGFTDFNLNEVDAILNPNNASDLTITYHLTIANANADDGDALNLSPFNNATASTIYARVENSYGCHVVSTINLKVSTTSFPANSLQELVTCDDDGLNDGRYSFDLEASTSDFLAQFPTGQKLSVYYYESLPDAQLNQNKIKNTSNYINTNPFSQLIYVRVQSDYNGDCFGVGPYLQLTVNLLPEFTVDQSENFCLNGEPIVLETYNPKGNYSYIWTDQSNQVISTQSTATVASEGTYTVTASSREGCESPPVEFTVVASGIANLTDANVSIDDLSEANTITIDTSNLGIGDYEFALGSIYGPYQDSPIFNNVPAGNYTLYVNDKNGCGIAELEVYVLGFAKYFTPNNDGFNDTWNIKGFVSQFSQQSYIDIFDRYGLFLARIRPSDEGWDGLYKGEKLPMTDYWFVAHFLDDEGQTRNFKGHFSLIR